MSKILNNDVHGDLHCACQGLKLSAGIKHHTLSINTQ